MKHPVMIIGAGLSGLRTASLLLKEGIDCVVLEARDRVGGRVLTEEVDGDSFDLGPTWFWPNHESMIAGLVNELGLKTFDQHAKGAMVFETSVHEPVQYHELPAHAIERSVCFAGGVKTLIYAVSETIPPDIIELGTRVSEICGEGDAVKVRALSADGAEKEYRASAVIMAIPPRLALNRITFTPDIPADLRHQLNSQATWMGGQAKVIAVYDRPFWREHGLSGHGVSWAGPMQEIHDASPYSGEKGAIFGFFGLPAHQRYELGEERLLTLVKEQLVRLFGEHAVEPSHLLYQDWSLEKYSSTEKDVIPLTEFPPYGPLKAEGEWENKLFFAGTETSSEFGGHLEGALRSAERVVDEVKIVTK
ncbi:flavin monoamine oxidase family protein [Jeotgalibacillus aurantiacus]|uniref:flavin monoamine oxidase family protein n=1 Tax=Jeotgalibacillus aurantiacus TaxID=2763266 RepID=UPI001D0A9858|nr:FAD-dependent oxidoreductase [Jeotgalibacillus aurantiacus]